MHAKPFCKILDIVSNCREARFFRNCSDLFIGAKKKFLRLFYSDKAEEFLKAKPRCLFDYMGQIINAEVFLVCNFIQSVEPPKMNTGFSNSNFVSRIGKTGNDVKLLLDCRKLLAEKETADLSDISQMM